MCFLLFSINDFINMCIFLCDSDVKGALRNIILHFLHIEKKNFKYKSYHFSQSIMEHSNLYDCCKKNNTDIKLCIKCFNIFHTTCLINQGYDNLPLGNRIDCCGRPNHNPNYEYNNEIINLNRILNKSSFQTDLWQENKDLKNQVQKLKAEIVDLQNKLFDKNEYSTGISTELLEQIRELKTEIIDLQNKALEKTEYSTENLEVPVSSEKVRELEAEIVNLQKKLLEKTEYSTESFGISDSSEQVRQLKAEILDLQKKKYEKTEYSTESLEASPSSEQIRELKAEIMYLQNKLHEKTEYSAESCPTIHSNKQTEIELKKNVKKKKQLNALEQWMLSLTLKNKNKLDKK